VGKRRYLGVGVMVRLEGLQCDEQAKAENKASHRK
jgi:hypothetical protein